MLFRSAPSGVLVVWAGLVNAATGTTAALASTARREGFWLLINEKGAAEAAPISSYLFSYGVIAMPLPSTWPSIAFTMSARCAPLGRFSFVSNANSSNV